MESVLGHFPLALFTTLGAFGAGGFVALAIAFFSENYSDEEYKSIDKKTLIPFIIVVVGFICVAFHITAPLKAFGVFEGLGRSPLSNEVVYGIIFVVVALIYTVMAFADKLSKTARKAFSIVVAILAIAFAAMMAFAYMVNTIPSWCNAGTVCQMLGFMLVGTSLGLIILPQKEQMTKTLNIVVVIGVILAIVGLIVQCVITSGMTSGLAGGSAYVAAAIPYMVVALVLAVIGLILCFIKSEKLSYSKKAIVINILFILAIFFGRLAFYVMQVSIGI